MKVLFLIFYVWTGGLILGIFFLLLLILGRARIEGYELRKLFLAKEGLIVISNHPSLWEPALLPFLFFPYFLFFPKMIPFSTPDRKNYFDKWWFIPFRPVSIPIERGKKKRGNSLRRLFRAIRERKIIILFPEGNRTCNGTEFKVFEEGKIKIKSDWDEVKNEPVKIARFQPGVSYLLRNQINILPIWVEGTDKVIPNRPIRGKKEGKVTSKRFSFPQGLCFPFPRLWKRVKIKIGEPKKAEEIPSIEDIEDVLIKLGAV